MLKIYLDIVGAAWKVYGIKWKFWSWLIVLPIYIIFTRVTLFLDDIFFSQYKKLEVKAPIFIVGNPRSGTTFLHLLLNKTGDFVSFKSWEIFFPSLTARVIFKPLFNLLIKFKQTTILPEESGHPMGIDVIEHDEFLFFHKLNTQFVILLSPLAFDEQPHTDLCFYDLQDETRRRSSVEFFRRCLQRQMYYSGKDKVIAHGHFSTYRIKSILEVFPDAKFIYILRSPYDTIPSHLTLEYNTFKYQKRLDEVSPEKVQKYFELRYYYDVELYRYFYELEHNQEIAQDKLLVVSYEKMRTNLKQAIDEIAEFAEIELSEALEKAIEEQASKQGNYKRKHEVMSLEEFNLTRDKITEDFSFLLKEYGYE